MALVWLACLAGVLSGEQVSQPTFNTSLCLPATVPGTAFNTLLKNNKFNFTDPFYDSNLYDAPDINQTGRDYYTYFWRTEFTPQHTSDNGAAVWLKLRGINYRAKVFVDGVIIPEDSTQATAVEGMYRRWNYLLSQPSINTTKTSTKHTIAILVEPPDFPGSCRVNCKHCGQGGSHGLAKSTTMQFAAGWDWIRGTPDRNTGIWDRVEIVSTGIVSFRHPFVSVSNIILEPDVSASLIPSVTLIVRGTAFSSSSRIVRCNISSATDSSVIIATVSKNITLSEGTGPFRRDNEVVTLPTINIASPQLWWPHTHGRPNLYLATFMFINADGDETVEATTSFNFGIRKVTTEINPQTAGRSFTINDVPIFLQGGNWIHTDQFLRFATDSSRYYNEVNMHREMGMNIIRVWGGGLTERPEFFNAADKLGVLVMQEFWMSGDNNGRWAGEYTWPLNHDVYLDNAKDMILMLRNHPSLLFWCGGNELFPANKSPPPDISNTWPTLLAQYDQPGRFYIPSSMSYYTNFDPTFALAPKDGPYGILLPQDFYTRNPGLVYWNGTRCTNLKLSFQPEIGSVSTPTLESLQRFMSPENLAQFPGHKTTNDNNNIGPAWDFHNFIGFTTPNTTWRPQLKKPVNHIHLLLNGPPHNISEYALAGSIVQMQQYQCLFEGFQQFMWKYYTAVLMWKSQSPWPVLRGSFYDNYMAMTGGYWGVKRALRGSIHVQLNLLTWQPTVLNKGKTDYIGNENQLTILIKMYTMKGICVSTTERSLTGGRVASQEVLVTEKVDWPSSNILKGDETLLIRVLLLEGRKKETVVSNFYWSSDPSKALQQYRDLAFLRRNVTDWVDVSASISFVTTTTGTITLSLSKDASAAAMFVQLDLVQSSSEGGLSPVEKRILPVWFSDNLICLVPGETMRLTLTTSKQVNMLLKSPSLRITGWNVQSKTVLAIELGNYSSKN
jgi:hypothetical protein